MFGSLYISSKYSQLLALTPGHFFAIIGRAKKGPGIDWSLLWPKKYHGIFSINNIGDRAYIIKIDVFTVIVQQNSMSQVNVSSSVIFLHFKSTIAIALLFF